MNSMFKNRLLCVCVKEIEIKREKGRDRERGEEII